jgi:thiamine biosynthesis protein ThiI
MREPDCVLVRVGEAALKSEQVQARWFRILQENIQAALSAANVKAELETNPNRVFVYTSQAAETMAALSMVFGITSMSPAWVTSSKLEEISNLATDLAKDVLNIDEKHSFAIRAHRAGRHEFTSKEVAEAAGAAVKRVTGAKVDLDEPGHEIEIEVRSRRSYIIVERMDGPSGLPLGSGGKALALLHDRQDAIAAWLVARRGIELVVMADAKGIEFVDWLRSWHVGRELKIIENIGLQEAAKQEEIKAVVMGEKTAVQHSGQTGLLVLRPLVGTGEEELEQTAFRIKLAKE